MYTIHCEMENIVLYNIVLLLVEYDSNKNQLHLINDSKSLIVLLSHIFVYYYHIYIYIYIYIYDADIMFIKH